MRILWVLLSPYRLVHDIACWFVLQTFKDHPNLVQGGLSSWSLEAIMLLQMSPIENGMAIIDSNECADEAHGKPVIVISSTE